MKIFFLFLIILAFTGCLTDDPAPIVGTAPTRGHAPGPAQEELAKDPQPIPLAILYKSDSTPGMFEPDGVYLGAWLRDYTGLREFELATGRRHAVYVYEMQLGDDVPIHWLLECISNMATPLIVLHPPEPVQLIYYEDYIPPTFEQQVEALAHRLGVINLPMFVAFYPPGHGLGAPEFTLLFNQARAIFMAEAPLAAFIWVAPSLNVTPRNPFFPGHSSVDWVGVSLFATRAAEGLATDVLADFENFYMNFAPSLPIAILPLGISHFSRIDHAYHIDCASAEIKRVYNALGAAFPRVRMIVYGDNYILLPHSNNDFSLTLDPDITAAYREAIQADRFLTQLARTSNPSPAQRWTRSGFGGYYYQGSIYLDPAALQKLGISPPRQTREINGSTYIDASALNNHETTICLTSGIILLGLLGGGPIP